MWERKGTFCVSWGLECIKKRAEENAIKVLTAATKSITPVFAAEEEVGFKASLHYNNTFHFFRFYFYFYF